MDDLPFSVRDAVRKGQPDRVQWLLLGKTPAEVKEAIRQAAFKDSIMRLAVQTLPNETPYRLRMIDVLLRLGIHNNKYELHASLETAIYRRMNKTVAFIMTHPKVDKEDLGHVVKFSRGSLLTAAVIKSNIKVIKVLLDAGADACIYDPFADSPPLGLALRKGNARVVDFFLSRGHLKDIDPKYVRYSCESIMWCATMHPTSTRFIPRLLALGCDPGRHSALAGAVRHNNEAAFVELLKDPRSLKEGSYALREACLSSSSAPYVSMLLEAGVSAEMVLKEGPVWSFAKPCLTLLKAATRMGVMEKLRFMYDVEAGLLAEDPKTRRRARQVYWKMYRVRREVDRPLPSCLFAGERAAGVLELVVTEMAGDVFDTLKQMW